MKLRLDAMAREARSDAVLAEGLSWGPQFIRTHGISWIPHDGSCVENAVDICLGCVSGSDWNGVVECAGDLGQVRL